MKYSMNLFTFARKKYVGLSKFILRLLWRMELTDCDILLVKNLDKERWLKHRNDC